ncbi:MAG: aminotransferase class V-fold PLP-dependent enzyme [Planctomycetota bacterium]|nr:aminotransferase class V-fold PLP-dependent enzyme [Planctomycetota bacterium]MDA1138526.1 aminotransferase class V-fold PLP-dependent enzyme [Planctomycetota bacterium]
MSIYEKFGLTPIINASGAVTRLGGAPMPDEVLNAFTAAAKECVPLDHLQSKACEIIADVTGTESGLVTAGAAASLTLGAAAILSGLDLGRMERLPQTDGIPNEFVMAREQRNGYDHSVRAAGARIIEVGMNEIVSNAGVRRTEVWEYEAAFGPKTAAVLYAYGADSRPNLREVVELAHKHKLPVLVDAAGELPPKSNLKSIAATGADLVAFSGGKAIRGVQSTGILCGKRDLISAAALQMLDMDDHWELWEPPANLIDKSKLPGIPRHGLGRGFKVSKEEIVALLTALRLFVDGSYDSYYESSLKLLWGIASALEGSPVECSIQEDPNGERLPLLTVSIDETAVGTTAMAICGDLRKGNPPIYLGHGALSEGKLTVNPLHLNEGSAAAIGVALRKQVGESREGR